MSESDDHSSEMRGCSCLNNCSSFVLLKAINESNDCERVHTEHRTLLEGNFIRKRDALQGGGDHVLLEAATNSELLIWFLAFRDSYSFANNTPAH